MKPLSIALGVLMLASCATVQHPATGPTVQYASMDDCQRQNIDTPLDCQKIMHKEATSTAVKVGAAILLVLSYFALVGLIIAGGR